MEERVPIRITDWVGLNTRDSDLEIADGASPSLANIEFFREGWRVRNGYSKLHTTALGSNAITGLFDGFNDILAYEGTNLKEWNGTTFVDITGATTLVSGAVPSFASYNALDMMVNGSANDAPKKWDGATFGDLGGSPPKADDIEVWRNHVWLAGLASPNQDQVRFSEIEDPELWPAGHFLRPSKRAKGRDLIAVRACPYPAEEDGTRLVAWASDAIFHFDGFYKALFQIYPVQTRIGCISKRSIVITDGLTYWVDENGIYASPDAGVNYNNISWNIQPTFDALNKSRLSLCCGIHFRYKRQIWWSFSDTSSSTHNKILVYNYGLSTPMINPAIDPNARHVWSVYTGINLMSLAEILSSGEYLVYGGESNAASSNGFVYRLDNGTDDADANAISWNHKSKRFLVSGGWSRNAVLRRVNLVHETEVTSPVVDLYADMSTAITESQTVPLAGEGASLFDSALWDTGTFGVAAAKSAPLWYNRSLSAAQFNISGNELNKLPRVYEMSIEVGPLRGTR